MFPSGREAARLYSLDALASIFACLSALLAARGGHDGLNGHRVKPSKKSYVPSARGFLVFPGPQQTAEISSARLLIERCAHGGMARPGKL